MLRLECECALSDARIAAALVVAKASVTSCLAAAGLTHDEAAMLVEAVLTAWLRPPRDVRAELAAPDFAEIHRKLRREGATVQLLCEECGCQA